MKKRFLSVAAGVLAVSAILAGCGSGAAKSESSAAAIGVILPPFFKYFISLTIT